jgi:hypothetical protein
MDLKNKREPGNSPGHYNVDDENSLSVANLSGNKLSNNAGFSSGDVNAPMASFARSGSVTQPTNAAEVGFGTARVSDANTGVGGQSTARTASGGSANASSARLAMQQNRFSSLKKRFDSKKNQISDRFSTSNNIALNKNDKFGNSVSAIAKRSI